MIALVLGGAPSVWRDLERAQDLTAGLDTAIVATNHAGVLFEGDLDAWATLHPELFAAWRAERAEKGLNTDYRAIAHRKHGGLVGAEVHPLGWSGSSGLYAAQVAVQALGASGVILCGVPMEREAGHIVMPGEWTLVEKYKPAWLAAKEAGLPVRSMGGWTADLFGEPDAEWVASLNAAPARKRHRQPPEAMMRIKMLRTRNFTMPEDRRVTTKYLADQEYTVKRNHGAAMVTDGDAKEVKGHRKPQLDHDGIVKAGVAAPAID
jgi:hypothetical protein